MKKQKTKLELRLDAINVSRNRCLSSWSMHPNMRRLHDVLVVAGYNRANIEYVYGSFNPDTTYTDVKQLFDTYELRARQEEYTPGPTQEISDEATKVYREYFGAQETSNIETSNGCRELAIAEERDDGIFIKEKDIFTGKDDIYDPKPHTQKATLHPKQILAARAIVHGILRHNHTGQLISAGTGLGKTFVIGSILRNLFDNGFFNDATSPYPIVVITKASVVFQTERVLKDEFGLCLIRQVKVLNIEQLRSFFGQIFLTKELIHDQGEAKEVWRWNKWMHPKMIIWDECHILKNEDSTQSKIAQAYNKVEQIHGVKVYQLFSSATAYMRVCEARVFAVSTGIKHDFGVAQDIKLTDEHWHDFARTIAGNADPYEYSPAAVNRLTNKLDRYIIRMKNVRPKHHALNGICIIDFRNEDERTFYRSAWERFQAEKARIEGLDSLTKSQSRFLILAQLTAFCKAAELCRADYLADAAVDTWNKGQALGVACRYKGTITKAVKRLINYHGWNREDISLIWGGSVENLSKKKKLAIKLHSNEDLLAALEANGINLKDFGLDFDPEELEQKTDEEIEFEKLHKLHSQDPTERQREINRFQHQKSKCCFFTFKSGGVGLSLHHQYEYARQRVGILTPTYSAVELVQGLGRLPRLTSLSDTPQSVVFYRGTVEESVAAKVGQKLRCLSKVVRQRESWEDCVLGGIKLANNEVNDALDDVDGAYVEDEEDENTESKD